MKLVRRSRKGLLFLFIVVLPMILAGIYYAFFAVDRYVSSSQVVVRQAGGDGVSQQMPALALVMGQVNPASREETVYLQQFINSDNMLEILEKRLNWRAHFYKQMSDPLFWLNNAVSKETLLDYYRRLISVNYDEITGLLNIEVQALSPEFAVQVQKIIIEHSEQLVNEISHGMAREQMRFADQELGIARKNYEQQRDRLLEFQSKNKLFDAEASADSRAIIVAELESNLTKERARLTALLAQLSSNSPQVRQQKNLIASLDKQVAIEKGRLVSDPSGGQLNVVAAKYRNLLVDSGISEEAYKLSVTALENARIEASKKIRTLVTVVAPTQPEEAIYPRHYYNLLTMLIALLVIFGIVRFIVASIEDHRD